MKGWASLRSIPVCFFVRSADAAWEFAMAGDSGRKTANTVEAGPGFDFEGGINTLRLGSGPTLSVLN